MEISYVFRLACFAILALEGSCIHYKHAIFSFSKIQVIVPVDQSFLFRTSSVISCSSLCLKEPFGANGHLEGYYVPETKDCYCLADWSKVRLKLANVFNFYLLESVQDDVLDNNTKTSFPVHARPTDCWETNENNPLDGGVYVIWPFGRTEVWCDQTSEGWTAIQKRMNSSESFDDVWHSYILGVGNRTGDLWLGMEYMQGILDGKRIKIILEGCASGGKQFSRINHYGFFRIKGKAYKFTMNAGGASLALFFQMQFRKPLYTAEDVDESIGGRCAKKRHGNSWFTDCFSLSLIGPYTDVGMESGEFMMCMSVIMKIKPMI